MSAYKADLIISLGGREGLSVQEETIVEMCSRDFLLLENIDAYLLTVGIFNRKRKQAYPLLASRMQVSDSLARKLQMLKLKRRIAPMRSLNDLLSRPSPTTP